MTIKTKRTKYRYIVIHKVVTPAEKCQLYALLTYKLSHYEVYSWDIKYGHTVAHNYIRVIRAKAHILKQLLWLVGVPTICIVHSI